MAEKFWTHLKLKNGDTVKFIPPAPDGDRLGGVTAAEKAKITSLQSDNASLKQLMPEAAPTVGKTLKVLSVNADGTFVCGWADGGSGGSTDVQINGTSIVHDGVANFETVMPSTSLQDNNPGVVLPHVNSFTTLTTSGRKYLVLQPASGYGIKNRATGGRPITADIINNTVKAALSDEKRIGTNNDGLTSAEMDNACAVVGAERAKGEWVLKGTWTDASEQISVDFSGCTEFFMTGKIVGTGLADLYIDSNRMIYQFAYNGTKYHRLMYSNMPNGGIMPLVAKWSTDDAIQGDNSTSYTVGTQRTTLKVQTIDSFKINTPSNVTEINIKIYAR